MNGNVVLEKPPLDTLLDHDLHNLIQCMASRFCSKYRKHSLHSVMITQEDLALEGYLGVTIAYESFDANMGFTDNIAQSFRTHAYPYIQNAMSTYCRKFIHTLSISEKAARSELPSMTDINIVHIDQLEDINFDIPIGSGMNVSYDIDEYFFKGFNHFECSLVKDHILEGYSLRETSQRHGLSKSRTREIISNLIQRMKARAELYVQDN